MRNTFIRYTSFCFILFFSVSAHAKIECKGYIITSGNDTIWGKMKIPYSFEEPVLAKMNRKIAITDQAGVKTVYTAGSIKGYMVIVNSRKYTFHSFNLALYDSTITTEQYSNFVFLQLVEKGSVILYKHHYYTHSAPMMTPTGTVGGSASADWTMYLYRPAQPALGLIKVPNIGFQKRLKAYFSDYPWLVGKIDSGDYKFKDTQLIVNTYNIWKMTH